MFLGNKFNMCALTDLKLLFLNRTGLDVLDVENNEIFLSWSLDFGQSKVKKVKKLRKLYHAIAYFQIQNFEAILSNFLNSIIIYNRHEALNFFLFCFSFIWNVSEPLINELSDGLYIKKHLLLWAITIPPISSRCTIDKQYFYYFSSFPLISSSNKIGCLRFQIFDYPFFESIYGLITVS